MIRHPFEQVNLRDGELYFAPDFLTETDSRQYLDRIVRNSSWQQQRIKSFGKTIRLPRLTAWHGDPEAVYRYSGITNEPLPWTNELTEIKKRVEKACEATFNSVLLNRYRDGRDSVSWHADDETALGEQPVIVSVSLGASRQFQMKHRFDTSQKCSLTLENGSALVMRGATQQYWLHQIPKTRKIVGERINLTFRLVKR